jgi:hypothetical protein
LGTVVSSLIAGAVKPAAIKGFEDQDGYKLLLRAQHNAGQVIRGNGAIPEN